MYTRMHGTVVVGWAVLVAACGGGGEDDFPVEGTSGTQVEASFPGWIPEIKAGITAEDHFFLVDTGAPITICDKDSFPNFTLDGNHATEWRGFGLTFPEYEVVSYDIFGDDSIAGLLGGTLLTHFAVRFDYQGGHAALYFDEDAPPGDDTLVVSGGTRLDFDLLGGGLAAVPGDCPPDPYCGTVELPATRIILSAHFEGQAEAQWVLLDSGASAIATSESFIASLGGNGSTRPRLDGVGITTAYGPMEAALSRVWRLDLAGGGESVALDDLPVLVLPNDDLLQSISNEVHRPIVALVGGSFLREFLTTIDYPNQRLVLEPYRARTHIPDDEFIGVGFTLQGAADGTWRIGDVYTGTDADVEGLTSGQTVEELGGTSITGMSRASVDALFDGLGVGATIAVGVLEAGNVVTKEVSIEDLLPSYKAP